MIYMIRRFIPVALAVSLAACAAPPPKEPRPGPELTSELLKPLTDAYRDYVAALVNLDSLLPKERADAMTHLQNSAYAYFPDDRDLIAKAGRGDDAARAELARRGRLLDALFAFWGRTDLPKWNDARKRICAMGPDARIVLVNTLFRMLLNGQLREQWPQIRFQLVEIGSETFETAVALFKAKVDRTPETVIFQKDDLVQVALVILAFGERGRPVIEEYAKSPRFNVRRAVAGALGEARAAEHFALLEHLMRKDTDWMVRADAAAAMGMLRDRERAGAALLAAMRSERDRNVLRYIADSLGTLIYVDAVPTLIQSLEVPDYDYVERAMFALFRITGQRHMTAFEWRKWFDRDYARWRASSK